MVLAAFREESVQTENAGLAAVGSTSSPSLLPPEFGTFRPGLRCILSARVHLEALGALCKRNNSGDAQLFQACAGVQLPCHQLFSARVHLEVLGALCGNTDLGDEHMLIWCSDV